MPGNIYLGDDIVVIFSSKSNSTAYSHEHGLLTVDTFQSILQFEERILAKNDWSEICLQNSSQSLQVTNKNESGASNTSAIDNCSPKAYVSSVATFAEYCKEQLGDDVSFANLSQTIFIKTFK